MQILQKVVQKVSAYVSLCYLSNKAEFVSGPSSPKPIIFTYIKMNVYKYYSHIGMPLVIRKIIEFIITSVF